MNSWGIGIRLKASPERSLVAEVAEDSPAKLQGLNPGDELLLVDEIPVLGLRSLAPIRGEKGSRVKLLVLRGPDLLEIELMRDSYEDDVQLVVSDSINELREEADETCDTEEIELNLQTADLTKKRNIVFGNEYAYAYYLKAFDLAQDSCKSNDEIRLTALCRMIACLIGLSTSASKNIQGIVLPSPTSCSRQAKELTESFYQTALKKSDIAYARPLVRLAKLFSQLNQKNYSQLTVNLVERALIIFDEHNAENDEYVKIALLTVSLCYFDLGMVDCEESAAKRIRDYFDEPNDSTSFHNDQNLLRLLGTYERQHKWKKAEALLYERLQNYSAAPMSRGLEVLLAQTHGRLGSALSKQKIWDAAIDHTRKACELYAGKHGEPDCDDMLQLARCYYESGQLQSSVNTYLETIPLLEKRVAIAEQTYAFVDLGKISKQLKAIPSSLEYLKKAIQITESYEYAISDQHKECILEANALLADLGSTDWAARGYKWLLHKYFNEFEDATSEEKRVLWRDVDALLKRAISILSAHHYAEEKLEPWIALSSKIRNSKRSLKVLSNEALPLLEQLCGPSR